MWPVDVRRGWASTLDSVMSVRNEISQGLRPLGHGDIRRTDFSNNNNVSNSNAISQCWRST